MFRIERFCLSSLQTFGMMNRTAYFCIFIPSSFMKPQYINRFILIIISFILLSDPCSSQTSTTKPGPVSLFTCQTPSITDFTENIPYELGMKFRSSQNGVITGIKYWKAPSESGQHTGRIWDAKGNLLASVEFKKRIKSQGQLLSSFHF